MLSWIMATVVAVLVVAVVLLYIAVEELAARVYQLGRMLSSENHK